jgi:hypothetical protein
MGLGRVISWTILGTVLVGWLVWPRAEPTLAAVELGGHCPQSTWRWAERWRGVRRGKREVRRVFVLCLRDGRTYAALVHWRSPDGDQILSWRPMTTFIGALPARARERVDVLDGAGRLIEYTTLDRDAGRVEFYTARSEFTGYGKLDPTTGQVERSSLSGGKPAERREPLVLPVPPDGPDGGGAGARRRAPLGAPAIQSADHPVGRRSPRLPPLRHPAH